MSATVMINKGASTFYYAFGSTNSSQGESLSHTVADMFTPSGIFSKDLCELPAIYTKLRNFSDYHGAILQQQVSRGSMMNLAHKTF